MGKESGHNLNLMCMMAEGDWSLQSRRRRLPGPDAATATYENVLMGAQDLGVGR